MNKSTHKKTWVTEISAFATASFTIYQGVQTGVIKPAAIGDAVSHGLVLASIGIPATACFARVTYKKLFRKGEAEARSEANDKPSYNTDGSRNFTDVH